MGDLNFDATAVAPATGEFEPVLDGTYPLAIVSSEKRTYTENSNVGWKLMFQVLGANEKGDESCKGRQFMIFLNLQHANPEAQSIAQREFSAICHVTGVLKPTNMAELHNKPFMGKVKVTAARGEYGPGNKIAQYLTIKGEKIGGGVVGAVAPSAAKPAATKAPAWAKAS